MLLDFDNIKVVFPESRVRMYRCCKATTSNKVIWLMSMGYSFGESLLKAQAKDMEKMVVMPINK